MLSNCPLVGELALDGDSEELILIRLCLKTWLNLLIEVGATSLWTSPRVHSKWLDACSLSRLFLLSCLCKEEATV